MERQINLCHYHSSSLIIFILVLFLSTSRQAQDPYPNFNWSEENFSGWKIYRGPQKGQKGNRTIQYIDISTDEKTVAGNAVQLVYPPTNPRARQEDANTCYSILKVPEGKTHAMRVGPLSPGGYGDPQGYKASYTLHVVPERATLVYRFAFVQQHDHGSAGSDDPFGFGGGATHAGNNAQFWMQVLDANNVQIGGDCANYRLYPGAGENVEWFTWNKCGEINNTPWMTDVVDLTPYIGQDITIEFNTMDCYTGHHFAYAYVSPETFTSDTVSHYCPYNDTAFVEAPRGFKTYEWKQVGSSTSIIKENSPQIGIDIEGIHQLAVPNPIAGTKYECTFTSYSGCSGTVVYEMVPDSVHVDYTFKHLDDKCNTVAFTDTAHADHNASIVAYYWNFDNLNSGNLNTTSQRHPEHFFEQIGTYQVQLVAESELGCTDTITKTVTIKASFAANFEVAESCIGDSCFFLNTSTGNITSTFWDFDDGTPLDTNFNTSHFYTLPGNHEVQLTVFHHNCKDTFSANATVNPKPQFNSFDVQHLCVNQSAITLNQPIAFTHEGSIIEWFWDFGDGSSPFITHQDTQILPHTYTSIGEYTMTSIVTTANSCKDTLFTKIEVNPYPIVDFTIDRDEGCMPLCVNFTNLSTINKGTIDYYEWNFGPDQSHDFEPSYCYNSSGDFEVELTATSDKACIQRYTLLENAIHVHPLPEVQFTASPYTTTIRDPKITFFNESSEGSSFMWDFDDGQLAYSNNPVHTFQSSGTYDVTLYAENKYTCVDSITNTITIDTIYNIAIPNAFSPNSDGIHDQFVIENIEHFYNQWGELIFTSQKSGTLSWDGTKNGYPLPVSTYYYILTLKDEQNLSGYITLIK